jgi:DHA1 family bicyclomycin/chloramphenicol resistance-like MFS transporter
LLLLITLLGVFPLDVILPSVPLLARDFAVDAQYIAYSISLFAIGVAISQTIIGPLSDRMGRKRLLIVGLVVSIAGAAGCIFATRYEGFMVFRLLQAVGCGCFVLSQALVQDKFNGHQRNAMRILLTSASGVFISLSPLAGSVLQRHLGWAGSFQVFVVLAIAVLVLALKLLQEKPTSAGSAGVLDSYQALLKDRAFLVSSLFSCLAFACHFSFVVVSPLLLIEQLGLTEFAFSMVFLGYGLAYLIGGFIASWLNCRIASQCRRRWVGDSHSSVWLGLLFAWLSPCMSLGFSAFCFPWCSVPSAQPLCGQLQPAMRWGCTRSVQVLRLRSAIRCCLHPVGAPACWWHLRGTACR